MLDDDLSLVAPASSDQGFEADNLLPFAADDRSNQTDFVRNWVSQGGEFDQLVLRFPEMYPDGDVKLRIDKIDGVSKKYPRIGWAHESRKKGRYSCLGAFVCPQFGTDECFFRERPRGQRRHVGSKYNTDGGYPGPKFPCSEHNVELEKIECDCSWTIIDEGDHWILTHTGSHNHPAPPPAGAGDRGIAELKEHLRHNPKATAAQLDAGTEIRPSTDTLDPKFYSRGYLKHKKRDIQREFHQAVTGSVFAVEALDAAYQWFVEIEKWKKMVYDSCTGGVARPRQIIRGRRGRIDVVGRVGIRSYISCFLTKLVAILVVIFGFKLRSIVIKLHHLGGGAVLIPT